MLFASAFTPSSKFKRTVIWGSASKIYHHMFDDIPSLVTSVKTFDASELTNTVVVSNSFWSNLSSKLPALLLAEILASFAFVTIASALITEGKFLLDVTSDDTLKENVVKSKREWSINVSKLILCIIVDILGSANEAIPVVGEVADVIYAPIAAIILRQLFQGSNIVFILEFLEEILPFTDVLPLATLCWVIDTFFSGSNLARALRIGQFARIMQTRSEHGSMKGATIQVKSIDPSDTRQ